MEAVRGSSKTPFETNPNGSLMERKRGHGQKGYGLSPQYFANDLCCL